MASYSEEYKSKCVGLLELLKENTLTIEGAQIKNVRELVKFLGISSYSIYKWQKEMNYLGRNMGEIKEEASKDIDEFEPDFSIENKEMREGVNFYDDDDMGITEEPKQESEEQNGIEFGTRFWQFVAKNMGIKNYAMPLKQLKMKIGMELINGSGLVESQKNVRTELKL